MGTSDIAVLGAGPAGAVAAICAFRLGLKVTVVDSGGAFTTEGPRRIDTLSRGAATLLVDLGLATVLEHSVLARSHARTSLWHGHLRSEAGGGHGLLIDRGRFDGSLRNALAHQGVAVVHDRVLRTVPAAHGWTAELDTNRSSPISSSFIIDALGASGGRPRFQLGPDRIALQAAAVPFGEDQTLLESSPHAWLWAASAATAGVVMAVVDPRQTSGLDQTGRSELLFQLLSHSQLFRSIHIEISTNVVVLNAGASASRNPVGPTHLRIGDAGVRYDPIAGQGLSHALRSAAQAAPVAATLVDAAGDHAAAVAFAEERHSEDIQQHLSGLKRTHAGSNRKHQFWVDYARFEPPADHAKTSTLQPETSPRLGPEPGNLDPAKTTDVLVLSESATLTTIPALFRDRIKSTQALAHRGLPQPIAFVNGIEIADVMATLSTPTSQPVMVGRLAASLGGPTEAHRFVATLVERGVLERVPCGLRYQASI